MPAASTAPPERKDMPAIQTRPTPRPAAFLLACSLLAACGGDAVSPPRPAAASATTATTLSATVGTTTTAVPTVRVTDEKGAPLSGAAVQFAIVAGGGALGRTSATTDATGSASAGSWTLGTTAGAQIVEATVAGLPAGRFTATATPGAPASITAMAGDNQAAAVGAAVSTAPAVVVKDQYGNVVPGTAVTFAVASGNGAITGASATTGADGVARLGGWTLGIAAGAQQVRATAGTLSAMLTATGTVPSGCAVTNYALGATLPLAWEAGDCASTMLAGRRYDRLQFTTTSQQQVDASVTGASGLALLLRNATTGHYVGLQPSAAFRFGRR